jgi:hypothetical protein
LHFFRVVEFSFLSSPPASTPSPPPAAPAPAPAAASTVAELLLDVFIELSQAGLGDFLQLIFLQFCSSPAKGLFYSEFES